MIDTCCALVYAALLRYQRWEIGGGQGRSRDVEEAEAAEGVRGVLRGVLERVLRLRHNIFVCTHIASRGLMISMMNCHV